MSQAVVVVTCKTKICFQLSWNDCCYIACKLVYCTHFEAGKIFRLKSQKYFKNQCIIGKQIQMQTLNGKLKFIIY